MRPDDPDLLLKASGVDEKVHSEKGPLTHLFANVVSYLELEWLRRLTELPSRTLLIVFSDHGFVENPAFDPTDKYALRATSTAATRPSRSSCLGLGVAAVRPAGLWRRNLAASRFLDVFSDFLQNGRRILHDSTLCPFSAGDRMRKDTIQFDSPLDSLVSLTKRLAQYEIRYVDLHPRSSMISSTKD